MSAHRVDCWIHPDKIRRAFNRRHGPRPDWRSYYRGVVTLGVCILKERRARDPEKHSREMAAIFGTAARP